MILSRLRYCTEDKKVVILKCDICIQFLVGFPIKRPCQSVDNQGFPVEKIYMDHNISLDGYNLDNEFPVFMKMCHHSFCLLRVLKNHDDSPHNSNHDLTVKIKTLLISQLTKGIFVKLRNHVLFSKFFTRLWDKNSARLFAPISNNFPNVSHLMPRAWEIIFC